MGFSVYSLECGKEIFGEKAASKKIINILMKAIC